MIAENNQEFRSPRQQDAEEYLQWLLDRLNKEEPKFVDKKHSELFDYQMCNRLVCVQCGNYKLVNEKTNLWKFPVPPPSSKDVEAFYNYLEGLKDEDLKKAKTCE